MFKHKDGEVSAKFVTSLDDWQDVKTLHKCLLDEGFGSRIQYSLDQLQYFFMASLQQPRRYVIILVYEKDVPVHISIMHALSTVLDGRPYDFSYYAAGFSRTKGIHGEGFHPTRWTELVKELCIEWSRFNGYDKIQAFVREDASFKALERRYGLKKKFVVVEAPIDLFHSRGRVLQTETR